MKKIYTTVFLAFSFFVAQAQTPCVDGMAGSYPCQNMDLLSYMSLLDLGVNSGGNTNDVWGWVSPNTGKEYALVGCSNGTAFVDVSDPVNPIYLGMLPTHTVNSLWRDVEAWNNYCFVGSEAQGHGLQVMNLLQLDNVTNPPVTFEEDAHYPGFGNSHTINIDPVAGFCYAMGTNTFSGGLHIIDINDPLNPTLAGGFSNDGYTHDGYIMTYTGPDANYLGDEIMFACNADAFTIVNCTDKTDCSMISTYSYPTLGYVHQGWFTKDFRYFLLDDELDEMDFGVGTRTHIFDLINLDNPVYMGFYEADNSSIDHNLYIKDQFVFESNYRSGVRVLDASRRAEGVLNEVAFFDLYPNNDNPQFSGTWSNYIYLPSEINLATSMYDGFFITRPNLLRLSSKDVQLCNVDEYTFSLSVVADLQFPLTVTIEGLDGATIDAPTITSTGDYSITLSDLITGPGYGNYDAIMHLNTTFGESYELPFHLNLSDPNPAAPSLMSVMDGSVLQDNFSTLNFVWSEIDGATSYDFEISDDASFNNILFNANVIGNEYVCPFDFSAGNVYYWRVRANNNCGSSSWAFPFDFQVITVSVEDVLAPTFSLSPNPTTGEVLIVAGKGKLEQIKVVDITGKTVFQTNQSVGYGSFTLDLEHLSPGVYFIQIGSVTKRIVKK